jgi:signal transduction histidine kinase
MKDAVMRTVVNMVEVSMIKRNKLFGRVAIFAICLGAIHAVKDGYTGPPGTALVDILIVLVILGCYLIYLRGYIGLARIIGLTFLNLTFTVYACLVPQEVGVYLFYFPLIAISAAIFGSHENLPRFFFMGFSAVCLLVLFASDFKIPGIEPMKIEAPKSDFFINLITSAVVLVACINFILQIGRETEQTLYDLATEVRVQNQSLEKTNAELDRFLYSTSHDLRSPLMSIKGLVNIARREKDGEVVNMYLNMIMERADKLDFFIKDIIDYARNSRTDIECDPLDFDALIDEVWDNYRYMEGAERIRFTKEVSTEQVSGDRSRILTLFNNLVSNAVKYHNVHHPDPYIRVSVVGSSTNARITIEDNGIGIQKDRLGKVFDMFYRAHDYSKGSGLGLYIVKEVVDKLNGNIRVSSIPMQGTTFTVALPVKPTTTEARNGQQSAASAESERHSIAEAARASKLATSVPHL